VTEPDIGHLPVPAAVRGVTLAAQSRIVVKSRSADPSERPRPPERLGDPPRPASLDRITAPSVPGGYALEQQMPSSGVAAAPERIPAPVIPLIPSSRHLPGRDKLDAGRWLPAHHARRRCHHARRHG
jgi:hypothetical protein